MAHFCIVAPVRILEGLKARRQMGRHHLLLAHDVAANQDAYRRVFADVHGKPFSFIIMDNSVIETGNSVSLEMIREACNVAQPSCVVLPDILEDARATAKSCIAAVGIWHKAFGPLMYCPQGKTLQEFTWCAEQLAYDSRIEYWGCPRNLVANIGTRSTALKVLQLLNPKRPIHMLGFSDNFVDDMLCANQPETYSIDSAVPLRCTTMFTLTTKMPPRGDWWQTGTVNELTITNLGQVRSWCESRYAAA